MRKLPRWELVLVKEETTERSIKTRYVTLFFRLRAGRWLYKKLFKVLRRWDGYEDYELAEGSEPLRD